MQLRCKCTDCWKVYSPCGREPEGGQSLCSECNLDTNDDTSTAAPERPFRIVVSHPSYWASFVRRLLNW